MKIISRWVGGELANFFRIIQISLISIALIGVLFGLRHNVANLTLVDGILNQDDETLDAARQQLEGITTNRTADWLAFLYFEQGAFDDALVQFEQALADGNGHSIYSPETSEYWFLQGIWSAKHQDWTAAILAYRSAFALHPRVWDAGLYELYYTALSEGGNETERAVARWVLDGVVSSAEFTPPMPLTTPTICPHISAIQYDPAALAAGPLMPIVLHDENGNSQTFLLVNLVPNAGFEWETVDDRIIGFEKTIYIEDNIPETRRLIQAQTPYNENTTVATLTNRGSSNKTSYQSFAIEIDPISYYFVGGWGENIGNEAPVDLGFGWYGRGLPEPHPYHFLSIKPSDAWQFVADITPMPQVTEIDFVFSNQNAPNESRASFDDLLLFQLDPATCTPVNVFE